VGLLATAVATDLEAGVQRRVDVSYTRSDGSESRTVETEVTFVTGRELNRKTRTFDYDMFSNCALIWFDEDEVAIIKLDTWVFGVGEEFDAEDFRSAFRFAAEVDGEQVNSHSKREWHHHERVGPRQVAASIAAAVPSPLDGSAGAGCGSCGRRRPVAGVQGAVGARPFARP
jgi:hypothetical protein